jgi:hypothetical protein
MRPSFYVDEQGRVTDGGRRQHWKRFSTWIFFISLTQLVMRLLFPASCSPLFVIGYAVSIPSASIILFYLVRRDVNRDIRLYREAARKDHTVLPAAYDWLFGHKSKRNFANQQSSIDQLFMKSSSGTRTAIIKAWLMRFSATSFVASTCFILAATALVFSFQIHARCPHETKNWCRTLLPPSGVSKLNGYSIKICGDALFPKSTLIRP